MTETTNAVATKKYPDGFTFDPKQAAHMLGISRSQLRRLRDQRIVMPVSTSGSVRHTDRYDPNDIDRLLITGGVKHLTQQRLPMGTTPSGRMNRLEAKVDELLGLVRELTKRR